LLSTTKISHRQFEQIEKLIPLVSVNAIIRNEWGKFLLLKRKNPPMKGQWWACGGIVQKGESLDEALRRKIEDETRLRDYEIDRVIGVYSSVFKKRHCIDINFLIFVSGEPTPTLNWEHSDYLWTNQSIPVEPPTKNSTSQVNSKPALHPYLFEWLSDSWRILGPKVGTYKEEEAERPLKQ